MGRIEEVTVNTLGELLDKTTPATCDPASGRRRDGAIYRGVDGSSHHLLTSIDRLGGISPPHSKAHLDARIAVQSAAFTIASSKTHALDELLIGFGLQSAVKRFIIPGDKVDYIRDQLDLCSVDERRLFPELDGVAQEMTRYYSTSPA